MQCQPQLAATYCVCSPFHVPTQLQTPHMPSAGTLTGHGVDDVSDSAAAREIVHGLGQALQGRSAKRGQTGSQGGRVQAQAAPSTCFQHCESRNKPPTARSWHTETHTTKPLSHNTHIHRTHAHKHHHYQPAAHLHQRTDGNGASGLLHRLQHSDAQARGRRRVFLGMGAVKQERTQAAGVHAHATVHCMQPTSDAPPPPIQTNPACVARFGADTQLQHVNTQITDNQPQHPPCMCCCRYSNPGRCRQWPCPPRRCPP